MQAQANVAPGTAAAIITLLMVLALLQQAAPETMTVDPEDADERMKMEQTGEHDRIARTRKQVWSTVVHSQAS